MNNDKNISCAVNHVDEAGNPVPCPGYPHKDEATPVISGDDVRTYVKPQDDPQPPTPQNCSSCHAIGPNVVQDAIDRLNERITSDRAWTTTWVDSEDLSVVLTALERHHAS